MMEINEIINQAEMIARRGSGASDYLLMYERMLKQLKICAKTIKEIDDVIQRGDNIW